MAKVVMLTALVGEGIDIVTGDACECSDEEANSLLAVEYAREFAEDGSDDKRPLKSLNSTAAKAALPERTPPKPTRKRGQKETKDVNDQGEEADPS